MPKKIFHPIIIKLYLLRNDLYFLEKKLDEYQSTEEWPIGQYEEVLIATDRFHRARNKAVQIFGSETTIDNFIYLLDKMGGEA